MPTWRGFAFRLGVIQDRCVVQYGHIRFSPVTPKHIARYPLRDEPSSGRPDPFAQFPFIVYFTFLGRLRDSRAVTRPSMHDPPRVRCTVLFPGPSGGYGVLFLLAAGEMARGVIAGY